MGRSRNWLPFAASLVVAGSAFVPIYHAIVKGLARKNFLRVNEKDYEAILRDCAPDIRHRFGGHHALGGERHDIEGLRRWFERLGRLAPELQLRVHDVWVQGLPNDTIIFVRWSGTDTFPDGSPYNNHGVHVIRMKWGKVVDIDANEDSQIVSELLAARAAQGMEEAKAAPIVS